MTAILLCSDLHLADGARNFYRWGFFRWLAKKIKRHSIKTVLILGDLTDAKDRHSAALVNNTVEHLQLLVGAGAEVVILRGNHDCFDPASPFFEFVSQIPGIRFINTPTYEEAKGGFVLYLPHSRDPEKEILPVLKQHPDVEVVFMHQTVEGSVASNGQQLSGIPASAFKHVKGRVFSGDVHVPQNIGKVTYIGSPYQIKFGDTFTPRVLLIVDGQEKDLHFKTVRKHKLLIHDPIEELHEGMDDAPVSGDQVKIEVALARAQLHDWPQMRGEILAYAKRLGWDLCGLTVTVNEPKPDKKKRLSVLSDDPNLILKKFGEREKVDERLMATGAKILRKALG